MAEVLEKDDVSTRIRPSLRFADIEITAGSRICKHDGCQTQHDPYNVA
jgi:hypothetical protein